MNPEIILLLLLKYGVAQATDGLRFDPEATRLGGLLFQKSDRGHRLSRIRGDSIGDGAEGSSATMANDSLGVMLPALTYAGQ